MNRSFRMTRAGVLAAGTLTAALTLSACGDDSTATSSPGAAPAGSSAAMSPGAGTTGDAVNEHNDADTAFAQLMTVHHRGAIEMAQLAATRAAGAEVKTLATTIEAAQQPEIDTMTSWLTTWGEDVPTGTDLDGMEMEGMDHGGDAMTMPGMMTDEQMGMLEGATGVEFDRMFLEMMTEHHQGAITMAEDEKADGQYPEAVDLAGTIITAQTREIAEMKQLLAAL